MASNLIAYAMDAASFILQKTKKREQIKQIILFGSAAREEAGTASDIDLYIDVVTESEVLEQDLKKSVSAFFSSTKYKNYWKALGIKNEINLMIGVLNKWKDLQSSLIANGVILYGKYKPTDIEGKHNALFAWENITPNAKRVLINKQIFGHALHGKWYNGLLQKYQGTRLGKGCIIVPSEHGVLFHKLFKKHAITVKIKKIIEY